MQKWKDELSVSIFWVAEPQRKIIWARYAICVLTLLMVREDFRRVFSPAVSMRSSCVPLWIVSCFYLAVCKQWGLHPSTGLWKTRDKSVSYPYPWLHFFSYAYRTSIFSGPVFLFLPLFTFASYGPPNYEMNYLTECRCIFLSCL